jgi:alpha-beta hydrolase superfamily lysophospholipase
MKTRLAALVLLAPLLVLAAGASAARPDALRTARCSSAIDTGVLPRWARGGFSDPHIAHVLGRAGRIVAILFARPLYSPPTPGRNNKILWVARASVDTPGLRIVAQRMRGSRRTGAPVQRFVRGGPGPSIINVPSAGCWRFTLRWSGRTDSLDLVYESS